MINKRGIDKSGFTRSKATKKFEAQERRFAALSTSKKIYRKEFFRENVRDHLAGKRFFPKYHSSASHENHHEHTPPHI
jgi:hypothetical protein